MAESSQKSFFQALADNVGTLAGSVSTIFDSGVGAVESIKNRIKALKVIDQETVSPVPAVQDTRVDPQVEANAQRATISIDNPQTVIVGTLALVVVGIIIAKALK